MIKLGLENAKRFSSIDASPLVSSIDASLLVAQALSKTVQWCSVPKPKSHSLRSPETDPSAILEMRRFPETDIKAWVQEKYENYRKVVSTVIQQRADLLRTMALPTTDQAGVPGLQGKLLVYFPLETVSDGAASASSNGFFDEVDAPPWDTWFWYSNRAILCWVSEDMASKAQAGIDANPVECIHWANWRDLSRLTT
jgi:hypothetical protein